MVRILVALIVVVVVVGVAGVVSGQIDPSQVSTLWERGIQLGSTADVPEKVIETCRGLSSEARATSSRVVAVEALASGDCLPLVLQGSPAYIISFRIREDSIFRCLVFRDSARGGFRYDPTSGLYADSKSADRAMSYSVWNFDVSNAIMTAEECKARRR